MSRVINVEERLLGMKAVEKRFISEKQLIECLNTIEFIDEDKGLKDVFREKGYLTQAQIKRLQEAIDQETSISKVPGVSSTTKQKFGEIAVEQNMIDEDQLLEALDVQETYFDRGIRVQLGQVLLKRQYLTLAQLERILGNQSTKVLYCSCKKYNYSKVIHNYDPGQIYQCDKVINGRPCGLDLTPEQPAIRKRTEKKKAPVKKKATGDDIGDLIEIKL